MSVRVNDRSQGDLTVIIKAKELASHTLRITNNEKYFPKRYRMTLTNRIIEKAVDIYTLLYEANEINPKNMQELEFRQYRQRQAIAYCRSLMALMDISKETFQLPAEKCRYWASMAFNVRNLTIAWYKQDEKRFRGKI